MPLAGQVAADRETLIVDKCRDPTWAPFFPYSNYESVIGFALVTGQTQTGDLLAVVTIDCTKANAFHNSGTSLRIESAVRPDLANITLVLELARGAIWP
jgi:hypothetical protein